ncbi:MAG: FKBP-type peptidyl-prolyl cis-trans isomerase [Polyangia bacterium]
METQDLEIGAGKTALTGAIVSIHYTGWFNRAKFDTSLSRDPLEFRLGKGEVLRGWDQGIPGMKVGGKRRLTLPPDFAYGAKGSPGGAIPPNSVLVFEIQLVDVKN